MPSAFWVVRLYALPVQVAAAVLALAQVPPLSAVLPLGHSRRPRSAADFRRYAGNQASLECLHFVECEFAYLWHCFCSFADIILTLRVSYRCLLGCASEAKNVMYESLIPVRAYLSTVPVQ